MGKNAVDYLEVSETGNWNVAKPYTEIKIMKWLYLIDEYETIARYGTSDMIDEFIVDQHSKNLARLKAIDRMTHALIKVIGNTKFALKKDDKKLVSEYKEALEKIESFLPKLEIKIRSVKDKSIVYKVKEKEFKVVLNTLSKIAEDLLEPLNKADLIFTSRDEFDPDELTRKIKEDIIFSG